MKKIITKEECRFLAFIQRKEICMKRFYLFISMVLILSFSLPSTLLASEPVDIEVAKRAAEYHGELIFETNLQVCDHQLMYWPSGEPAVYVFTLMAEKDFYPQDILVDQALFQGAYLVSVGKEIEGYTMMSQADRYMTVYVGATTDMPSCIKAHKGLPEHILALAEMNNPPQDPYWIYGGLYHIFLGSKMDMNSGESKVTEIHLGETVSVKEFAHEKVGAILASAEYEEWETFLQPDTLYQETEDSYLDYITGVKTGKKILPVDEVNIQGINSGRDHAVFVNVLKYLSLSKSDGI